MIDVRTLEGRTVKGWLLEKILGKGADGIVYQASRNECFAAVKIFFPEAIEKNGADEQNERLELQLALVGKKHHPNLVEIFEGGTLEELDTLYLIMEYVSGNALDKVLDKIPRDAIPSLLAQLVDAAKWLESEQLYHRDIKPANIIISDDFTLLTLLDLGIVFRVPTADEDQRLSGDEFVASVRYSPPEFVWRREDASNTDAWRAITFYQIGATLHDMLMGKPIFSGYDSPRADLYDAVKYRSPDIDASDCPQWLCDLAKACLVKDWRARVEILKWESFAEPSTAGLAIAAKSQAIRIRQIRAAEAKIMAVEQTKTIPKETRAQELWSLQSQVFMEIRDFAMTSQIFPKFAAHHDPVSEQSYRLSYRFEKDETFGFDDVLEFEVGLSIDDGISQMTNLVVIARNSAGELARAEWREILSLSTIVDRCQDALVEATAKIVS